MKKDDFLAFIKDDSIPDLNTEDTGRKAKEQNGIAILFLGTSVMFDL
jgi:hypothetical protein